MSHEPKVTLHTVLSRVAAQHEDEPSNAKVIYTESVAEALRLKSEDMLADEIPDDLLAVYLAKRFRGMAENRGKFVKAMFSDGIITQTYLDLGTDFDSAFVVCGRVTLSEFHGQRYMAGRIVTLGAMTSSDVFLMDREQQENLEKQTQARERAKPGYLAFGMQMLRHPNYRAMRTAEDFMAS